MYIYILLRAYVNQNFYWPRAFDSGTSTLILNNEQRDNARHIAFSNEEKAINVARYNLRNCLHAVPMGPSFFNNAALLLKLKTSLSFNQLTNIPPLGAIGPISLKNVDIFLDRAWKNTCEAEFLKVMDELRTLEANRTIYEDFGDVMKNFLERTV